MSGQVTTTCTVKYLRPTSAWKRPANWRVPPVIWATASWARISASTCTTTWDMARTSAAKRPHCWSPSKARKASRGSSLRSRPASACMANRPPSTIPKPSPAFPTSSIMAGRNSLGLGKPNNGGTKLFSVSGHVNNPGNFEVPMGTPFKKLLEMAGGMRAGRKLEACIPGGSSMPVLPGEIMMDLTMDYDSISKAGSMLGTGAVIIMDDTTCMVRALERLSYFYYEESCGQCTPCREGTGWLYRIVHRIEHGEGRREDLALLDSVAKRADG